MERKVTTHIVIANTSWRGSGRDIFTYATKSGGNSQQSKILNPLLPDPLKSLCWKKDTFRKCHLRTLWSFCSSPLLLNNTWIKPNKQNPFSPGLVLSLSPCKAKNKFWPHWSIQAGLEHPGEKIYSLYKQQCYVTFIESVLFGQHSSDFIEYRIINFRRAVSTCLFHCFSSSAFQKNSINISFTLQNNPVRLWSLS